MASISVIVPTYTRARLLKEALETILAQTRPVNEIIVVDDGSSDDTREVVTALAGPISYIHQENGGKPRALNNALSRAKGDVIWICDDDDLLLPTACETLSGALEESGADVAFGTFDRFSDEPGTGTRTFAGRGYWPDLGSGAVVRHVLEDFFIFHNAMLVRRSAYERAGAFNEKMLRSEDYDMLVRLAVAGTFAYADVPVFHYRMHGAARGTASQRFSASDHSAKAMEFDRTVFRQHMGSLDAATLSKLYEGENRTLALRAAHLQRACIFARRVMWDEAIAELEAARSMSGLPVDLHSLEAGICGRILNGKYGIDALIDNDAALDALAGIGQPGSSNGNSVAKQATGRAILASIIRGGRWRIREALRQGDMSRAHALARAFGRLAGRRLPSILLSGMPRAMRSRSGSHGDLRERRDVVLLQEGLGDGQLHGLTEVKSGRSVDPGRKQTPELPSPPGGTVQGASLCGT